MNNQPQALKIGDKVRKRTNKPFKSTFKINTIKGFTQNEHTKEAAATFLEDETNVELKRLILA